jgi:hypothetical protein
MHLHVLQDKSEHGEYKPYSKLNSLILNPRPVFGFIIHLLFGSAAYQSLITPRFDIQPTRQKEKQMYIL